MSGEPILSFAKDALTGELRHVHEGPTGRACNCVCPGCGSPLDAINAGVIGGKKVAHFRHITGGIARQTCMDAARMFSFVESMRGTILKLPPEIDGGQGALFVASSETAAETPVVERVEARDFTSAVLTLSDGRELVVSVVSTFTVDQRTGERQHDLEVQLPEGWLDLSVSRDDLRKRLTLDSSLWRWCRYQTAPSLMIAPPPIAPAAPVAEAIRAASLEVPTVSPGRAHRVWIETTSWKNGDVFEVTFARYPSGIVETVSMQRVTGRSSS